MGIAVRALLGLGQRSRARHRVRRGDGAPARRSNRASPTTAKSASPVTTRIVSIGTTSASGPNTSIPIGIATAITIPTKPNTRPCRSGSTVSWSSVIDGVEKNGTASPTRNMNAEDDEQARRRGPARSRARRTSATTRRSCAMRLRFANSVATTIPPSTMPTLNAISSTARLTTFCCSPDGNERTSISGREVRGRDRQHEDDREQQRAATARTRGRRRTAPRRRGRRSSRSPRRRRVRTAPTGIVASRPMPIAAVTTSMNKIGTIASGESLGPRRSRRRSARPRPARAAPSPTGSSRGTRSRGSAASVGVICGMSAETAGIWMPAPADRTASTTKISHGSREAGEHDRARGHSVDDRDRRVGAHDQPLAVVAVRPDAAEQRDDRLGQEPEQRREHHHRRPTGTGSRGTRTRRTARASSRTG